MQSRRDWLVSQGLAKPGRGKFSTVAKQALDKARSEGVKFSDEVVETTVKPTGEKETVVKTKPKAEPTAWKSPDEYRYPENLYRAKDSSGKVYSMREACQGCGLSLCDHRCHTPVVLGMAVTIERAA